jgi:DNA-binding NtrC family response regulator
MKHMALLKILAVDVERNILNSLRRVFIDSGCLFIAAESCDKGLAILQQGHAFDVIISDYRMPGINGIAFLTIAQELQPETFRILLTGHALDKGLTTSLQSGVVSAYLAKPWDNEELFKLVENRLTYKPVSEIG